MTVPNLGYVVDFGQEVVYTYDYSIGADRLITRYISKDTAEQREGRAGRTGKGICIRMYSREEYDTMENTSEPEILYQNIDQLVVTWVRVVVETIRSQKESRFFDFD